MTTFTDGELVRVINPENGCQIAGDATTLEKIEEGMAWVNLRPSVRSGQDYDRACYPIEWIQQLNPKRPPLAAFAITGTGVPAGATVTLHAPGTLDPSWPARPGTYVITDADGTCHDAGYVSDNAMLAALEMAGWAHGVASEILGDLAEPRARVALALNEG